MSDERLVHVEEKLAYLEQVVAELSDVLHRQQGHIDRLTALNRHLGEKLVALGESGPGDPLDEKPPHY